MPNLPVPVLASEVANNLFTAALARAGIYTTGNFLLAPPLFVGTQTSAQSIGNNPSPWTAISLNTEQVDTYVGHDNVTNNSRYTAQVAGVYSVCGVVAYAANATGVRGARLHLNGSAIQGSAQMTLPGPGTNLCGVATPVRAVQMAVGDFVEVAAYQNSGASLSTTTSSDLSSALWVCWSHT
ncbi:hypothetical protein ACWDA7_30505 [Streptomyces sp. NPDC001156]